MELLTNLDIHHVRYKWTITFPRPGLRCRPWLVRKRQTLLPGEDAKLVTRAREDTGNS